ncbi:hypothetical protein ABMA28_009945 [Loxostege sticticalis]|uniref:Mutant cadherin n=1 Tax=Loxostege sticticalis TaxID=481309 RepID=A0ABD0SBY2_LOXSC
MTKVVKCNTCNVVIDEMLSYIQNKLSVIDEQTLIRICVSSFTKEEIEKSKSLLFDSIPTDKIQIKRKNKGKEERNLADIVNVFKTTEPDLIPVYCARDLERLPPILFDHLDCTKLLKDLLRVQNELKEVQSSYVTQSELNVLRSDILQQMRNDSVLPVPASVCKVNMKRGGWVLDSGPIGLSHVHDSSINETQNDILDDGVMLEPKNKSNQYRDIRRVNSGDESAYHQRSLPSGAGCAANAACSEPLSDSRPVSVTSSQLFSDNIASGSSEIQQLANVRENLLSSGVVKDHDDKDQEWQKVVKRRKPNKYRYTGTSGINCDNEGKFKAVERKIPIFITKVHKETADKDIEEYVYKNTQERITLEKISFKYERDYNAYKFFVKEDKVSMFLDKKLWPQGILFRRFVNYKRKINSDDCSKPASGLGSNYGCDDK